MFVAISSNLSGSTISFSAVKLSRARIAEFYFNIDKIPSVCPLYLIISRNYFKKSKRFLLKLKLLVLNERVGIIDLISD